MSLARPGGKQARKHVRNARDFNNIETRAVKFFFFPARHGAGGNSRHCDRIVSLFPSWPGYGLISTPVFLCKRANCFRELLYNNNNYYYFITIIIIIITIINCNWFVTQWQWLFYMYTKYEIGY